MEIKRRDAFIDILKGIGIVSIVIGHSSWLLPKTQFPIGPFVYTYHIMLFSLLQECVLNIKLMLHHFN